MVGQCSVCTFMIVESSSASDPLPCVCFAATIFAYGQTSSGKTFTMRGVTESAVSDIYRHIDNVSFINLRKSLLLSAMVFCFLTCFGVL